jgi:flagellar biosynthesis activator protein FlaF
MTDPYRRAAGAYSRGSRDAVSPRRLEGDVLLQTAQRLDELRRDWSPERYGELESVLLHNRKLWTLFAAEMANDTSDLPLDLRNNIASIAVFVFKRSLELLAKPAAEPIAALVEINRNIAAGLHAPRPPVPGPQPAVGAAETA